MSDEGNVRRASSVPTLLIGEAKGVEEHDFITIKRQYLQPDAFPRKLSMPEKVAISMKNASRRKSSADKQNKSTSNPTQDKKSGSSPKDEKKKQLNSEFFVPEEYLEAAQSPGSLREEIRELRTITEEHDSFLDFHFADRGLLFGNLPSNVKPSLRTEFRTWD